MTCFLSGPQNRAAMMANDREEERRPSAAGSSATPTSASATSAEASNPPRRVTWIRCPDESDEAGSSVTDATIVTRTVVDSGNGEAGHERDAHQEHAEQRDDDRDTREQDGPPGRVECRAGGVGRRRALDRGTPCSG